jgi:hypothetical protein
MEKKDNDMSNEANEQLLSVQQVLQTPVWLEVKQQLALHALATAIERRNRS